MKGFKYIALLVAALAYVSGYSQLSITTGGTDVVVDFQGTLPDVNQGAFQGDGFEPNPSAGRLDSDAWEVLGVSSGDGASIFGDTELNNDFARGTSGGGTGIGGLYCFIPFSGNFSLGVQPTNSDFTPGSITLKAINDTGLAVDEIKISYDVWTYNNVANATKLSFSHASQNIPNAFIEEPSVEYDSPS
nr:hypothetical protein [Saprospiraceae bacterium]